MTDLSSSSQTNLSRRTFLTGSASTGLGIALTGSAASVFAASPARGATPLTSHRGEIGYGPLVPDPNGLLALPKGFSYTIVARAGITKLESGHPTPNRTDGTGCFVRHGGNGSVLVVNHEIRFQRTAIPVPPIPGLTYDEGARGGTTNIEVDKAHNRIREYVSLAGTLVNCAGGKTPWQTWLTCEETDEIPRPTNVLQKRHGYVFEVDPYDQEANRDPRPLKFLGRFQHEAVAVDPDTHVIYETEDADFPNGLFYRWTPPDSALPLEKGSLRTLPDDAGTLEAMRASSNGTHVPDLSVATEPGTTYDVTWVHVPERDEASVPLRVQVGDSASSSRKLEGCWWGDNGVYVVASFARAEDGSAVPHDGQVWFFDPVMQTLTLKLRFAMVADPDADVGGPDNITISPYGGVILAEDGAGDQHIVGATDAGETFFLGLNQLNDFEFAGPTFSQDKKTLFINIYDPGIVFAIDGPWRRH